jgi:hypothetical protein
LKAERRLSFVTAYHMNALVADETKFVTSSDSRHYFTKFYVRSENGWRSDVETVSPFDSS